MATARDRPPAVLLDVAGIRPLSDGPPDLELQRTALRTGRRYWVAYRVGNTGWFVAVMALVYSIIGIRAVLVAAVVAGLVVGIGGCVARIRIHPEQQGAESRAGLPVPPEQGERLAEAAQTRQASARTVRWASCGGEIPVPRQRARLESTTWYSEAHAARVHWVRGNDRMWRLHIAKMIDSARRQNSLATGVRVWQEMRWERRKRYGP